MTAERLIDTEHGNRLSALQRIIRGRMPELDGLRALAIISVVWHNATAGHYVGGVLARAINMLSNAGWLGVQLFFVLSGFLITGILLDQADEPRHLRNFYMRRVLRIFPLYYAALVFAFLLLPLLGVPGLPSATSGYAVLHWLYLMNWAPSDPTRSLNLGHFWSLGVEEQFYLLWPPAVAFCRRRTLLRLCWFLIGSAILFRLVVTLIDVEFAKFAAYRYTCARWDALAGGALLAIALRDRALCRQTLAVLKPALLVAITYIAGFTVIHKNFAAVESVEAVLNQSFAILLFVAVLAMAIAPRDEPDGASWLRWPGLRSIGKYSYAMYVFHLPLIEWFAPFWPRWSSELGLSPTSPFSVTLFAAMVFVAAYWSAIVSWYVLEQPFLRLKRFFGEVRG